MDYEPDPDTGLLTEEYVDVYGIPFSVIPYKGRPTDKKAPEDRPTTHVRALLERSDYELRFPLVEGYAFALRNNAIKADVKKMPPLRLEYEPTAVFVRPTVGYQTGGPAGLGPGTYVEQDRQEYYESTHLQAIQFEVARQIVRLLVGDEQSAPDPRSNPKLRLESRHRLFPQVLRLVIQYLERKVDARGCDLRELGHERYVQIVTERLLDAIEPDDSAGEPPLLPILNRYKPVGTTAEVDFLTTRPTHPTERSQIGRVVLDTQTWERSAVFRLSGPGGGGWS